MILNHKHKLNALLKLGCIAALMIFSNVSAQTTPVACSTEQHKQFDFWQGEWRVTTPDGNHVGDNTLTKIQGGCVLQENWRAANSAFTGTSFNFFNASTEQWQQLWLDNQGGNLHMTGSRVANQMILKTAKNNNAAGKVTYNQITWTINKDGSVRQLWVAITEGQDNQVVFDGLYQRADSAKSK